MRRLVFLIPFLLLFLAPSLVLGEVCPPCPPVELNVSQDQPVQEWWMVLLEFLVQISAPLLTAILGVLGTWLIRKIGKKWDTENLEKVLKLKDGLITSGVAFAEEQARKALKSGEDKTDSAKKLSAAVEYIQEQLDNSGVEAIAEEKLVHLIEAKLHMERTKPDGVIPNDE